MALPAIMRRLFAGDGYGPLLKDDIVSRRISIQDWSSAFNYQPATAVRGSNGKPYWSVAASGPNSGGAANPVNDGGAHWVSLPSMADIAAMNYATQGWVTGQGYATQSWVGSQGYATQSWVGGQNYATNPNLFDNGGAGPNLKSGIMPYASSIVSNSQTDVVSSKWVKDLLGTPIYMDANGDDSNDGLSAGSAVKTFARALNIGINISKNGFCIAIAGGTYSSAELNGNDYRLPLIVRLDLRGDVTINGSMSLINVDVDISGEHNLTINSSSGYGLRVVTSSVICYSTVSLNISSGSGGVLIDLNSTVYFYKKLTVNSSVASNVNIYGIFVSSNSNLSLDAGCDIVGTRVWDGLVVQRNSSFIVRGGALTIAPIIVGATGLLLDRGSFVLLNGSSTIHSDGARCISIDAGSVFVAESGTHSYTGSSGQYVFALANNSTAYFTGTSFTFTGSDNGSRGALYAMCSSSIYFIKCSIHFSGNFTSSLFAVYGASSVTREGSAWPMDGSVSGSPKRYDVSTNSVLFTGGLGTNFGNSVTGSATGTAVSGGLLV